MVITPWTIWWLLFGASAKAKNELINPAIYAAFRNVEQHCITEQWPLQTVRCQKVIAHMNQCAASEIRCLAVDYYGELSELGFYMPALYLEKSNAAYIDDASLGLQK